MTLSQIRAELRRLVAGERTEESAQEAARLVAEYRAAQVRPRRPAPSAAELAAAERAEEDRKWRRTLAKIGRGGGSMSTSIYRPGGREGERPSVRRNEQKTYLRQASPWR